MDKDDGMISEFIPVSGMQTHILKFGHLPGPSQHAPCLFLIIPGNPGVIEYYEEFMRAIYKNADRRIPVWGISHAGHVTVSGVTSNISDITRIPSDQCSLEGQIKHKVAFIKQCIPDNVRLILIGHSIGCYLILKMLEHIPQPQLMRCFLLFPTIERMAESPRGLYVAPMLKYFRWLGVWLALALSYLSPHVQYRIILRFFKNSKVPECALNATMNLFDPGCINSVTFMAHQEMEQVTELPVELIKRNISKLSFYYGASDHWCPKEYCHQMKGRFPHADIRLCQHEYSHAYVLDASLDMAKIVWDWLQRDLVHKSD